MSLDPTGWSLRVVDANLNRAREGLRVVEDLARFLLDDASLSSDLRALRRSITESQGMLATAPHSLLSARSAETDVGFGESFGHGRGTVHDLASANFHRAQEALRVLEEHARLLHAPDAAERFERARYTAYDLEKRLVLAIASSPAAAANDPLPPARLARMRRFLRARLYVVTDRALSNGRSDEEIVGAALSGGADVIQLRQKHGAERELLATARKLRALCAERGALFIVNDRPGIAVLSDADGLHVGQDDLPVHDARNLIGPGRLLGVSTHSIEQARAAAADGADYIGVGPVYETKTKNDVCAPVGISYVVAAAAESRIPFVAIGGLKQHNVREVVRAGCDRIAVVSAAVSAEDVAEACRRLRAAVEDARGGRRSPTEALPASPMEHSPARPIDAAQEALR